MTSTPLPAEAKSSFFIECSPQAGLHGRGVVLSTKLTPRLDMTRMDYEVAVVEFSPLRPGQSLVGVKVLRPAIEPLTSAIFHETRLSFPFYLASSLVVYPAFRRRGISTLLMREFFEWHQTMNAAGVIGAPDGLIAPVSKVDAPSEAARVARREFYRTVCGWDAQDETERLVRVEGARPDFSHAERRYREPLLLESADEATVAAALQERLPGSVVRLLK